MLGFPDATTEFKFDLSLNYKISGIIHCYSDQKPTLVVRRMMLLYYFCLSVSFVLLVRVLSKLPVYWLKMLDL